MAVARPGVPQLALDGGRRFDGSFGLLVVAFEGGFEIADTLTQTLRQLRDFFTSEHKDGDPKDHQKFGHT